MELNIIAKSATVAKSATEQQIDKTTEKANDIMQAEEIYDSIVIGGGPAGYNAAIYMFRKGMNVLQITGDMGGQIVNTQEIENYLGFDFISGHELAQRMHKQVIDLGVQIKEWNYVEELTREDKMFTLKLTDGSTVKSKTVVLATGGAHRTLGVPGEQELNAKGVSYCAICDAPFFKDKKVVVVGGGDSAIEAAYDISKWASEVHIVHRSVWRADKVLLDRMEATENITYELGATIQEIKGNNSVESVVVHNANTDNTYERQVDGVFIEIGQDPRVDLVRNIVDLNENMEIKVDRYMRTNVDGLYAVGDVTDNPYKQIITAASDGAIAGLHASSYVAGL